MSGIMSAISPANRDNGYVSPLKKAIKDYQDEMLTGLTEDEKKEIDAKMSAYRKKCEEAGMDAESVRAAMSGYYKSLLKEYGAKFDAELEGAMGGADISGVQPAGVSVEGERSAAANTVSNTDMNTEVQTDPDGTVYLVITSPNGVPMKIKIGDGGSSKEELALGVQNAKKNVGIMDYEKNIDAFFEEADRKAFL